MTTLANLTTYFAGESASLLSAIESTKGGLRSLVKELDPVAAATDKLNRQTAMLDNALKSNKLNLDQHGILVARLRQRYDEFVGGQARLRGANGQFNAGLQQMSYNLNDVATQYGSNIALQTIFIQQFPQMIQAVQLMTAESKGLLGVMSSPWGIAFGTAAILVGTLSMKLFGNAEAAKAAALGNDGLSDAQSALGKIFDLTTGKIKSQNEVLLLNARLTAINMRAEAMKERADADKAFGNLGKQSWSNWFTGKVPSVLGTGDRMFDSGRIGAPARSLIAGVRSGRVSLEEALRRTENIDMSGSMISKEDLQQAIVNIASSGTKVQLANRIDKSLDTGKLDPAFAQAGGSKGGAAARDRSAQMAERFYDDLQRLQNEQLQLTSQITTDVNERAKIEHDRLDQELAAYRRDLDLRVKQKEITGDQAKQLLAQKEANVARQHTLVNWKLDEQLSDQALTSSKAEIDSRDEILRLMLDGARTMKERQRIQLQLLEDDIELKRLSLERIVASHDATEAAKQDARNKLAQLDQEKGLRAGQIQRNTMGPLASYLDSLPQTADEINEAFERAAADGIADVKNGLAEAIVKGEDLGDVLVNALQRFQIKALDLLMDKGIQKLLGDGSGSGGSGGFLSSLASLFGGGNGGSSSAGLSSLGSSLGSGLPGFANGGSFMVGGIPGIDRNLLSINGRPTAMVSADETIHVRPANDRGGGGSLVFDMRGAVVTEALLRDMERIANDATATGIGRYHKAVVQTSRQSA
ncbi:hypothetical protein [Sphingomonas sp. OTU376]|uniref:hypothetical protein n=1 Tax=Sphingomonas sp. OTU376 TaxID=3043863 RepID=UPI00313E99C1